MTRYEQETNINFNEEDGTATVYTYNGKIQRKLTGLCETKPDECIRTQDDGQGGLTFTVPKRWVKVSPPKFISDEQRANMAERMKRMQQNRF